VRKAENNDIMFPDKKMKNRWMMGMKLESRLSSESGIRKQVLDEIIGLAVKYGVKRVELFGSRARGDYKRTSDIDLAVRGGDIPRFRLDIEETSTLLKFDIVDLDSQMQDELRESIRREGKVLYEK
jgi:predicted nucleotidyltransferase